MVGKTPKATPAQEHRFEVIKEYGGCVACMLMGYNDVHASIEHVTESGRRIGKGNQQHNWTIGLCGWHHFGRCWHGRNRQQMVGIVGPSLSHGRKYFEEYFGREEILVQIQDLIIARYDDTPWPSYTLPDRVAREARDHWIELNREQSTSCHVTP